MAYNVTYRENDDTTPEAHDALQTLDTEEVQLEEVVENCKTYGVNAELVDEAGFPKGWVRADGNYQLN